MNDLQEYLEHIDDYFCDSCCKYFSEPEIKEEFDSEIEIVSFINEASHEYDFGIVTMKTYRSKLHTGNLTLLEHQDSKWLPIEELDTLEWAPVDIPAVKCLQQK